jgi:hypothetical protein
MVGDCVRPATMQPAWRAGEEPDNRLESATMQPAWRAGEEADNRLESATMQPAWRAGEEPVRSLCDLNGAIR